MNAEIVNRIIFILALLMLIMSLVGLIRSTLLRRKLKRRLYEAIKTLENYPNITLKESIVCILFVRVRRHILTVQKKLRVNGVHSVKLIKEQ